MTGKEELERVQSLRELAEILDKPNVAKLVNKSLELNAAADPSNPDAPLVCKQCCLLGGGT
jgi:hypothetical protein